MASRRKVKLLSRDTKREALGNSFPGLLLIPHTEGLFSSKPWNKCPMKIKFIYSEFTPFTKKHIRANYSHVKQP